MTEKILHQIMKDMAGNFLCIAMSLDRYILQIVKEALGMKKIIAFVISIVCVFSLVGRGGAKR